MIALILMLLHFSQGHIYRCVPIHWVKHIVSLPNGDLAKVYFVFQDYDFMNRLKFILLFEK